MTNTVRYRPTPTAARFHASKAFVRGLMGPIGSGKSVANCFEIFGRAMQRPADLQNRRRSRWAIIRNTYPELKSTTIKTWQDWFPADICPIKFDAPITGTMKMDLPDGTKLELELIFLALDRPQHVSKLLSLELTGGWINEAREVPKAILDALTGRVARFPALKDYLESDAIDQLEAEGKLDDVKMGLYSDCGVIMDTNPPDDDHWWYELAEENHEENWEFFTQPGALLKKGDGTYIPNPQAENVRNQPKGFQYWMDQISGKTAEWIKVYVLGRYGTIMDGRPIYQDMWSDHVHVSKVPLNGIKGRPLILAFDFGLTPAAIVSQVTATGQYRILREYCSESIGIRRFCEQIVIPELNREFNGFEVFVTGDPAGVGRDNDERTAFDILREVGLPAVPAITNNPRERIESVSWFLMRLSDGEPSFLLDPSCKILRKGFNGGYRIRRLQVSGEERYESKPEKNRFSHPHDALQYGALKARGVNLSAGQAQSFEPGGGSPGAFNHDISFEPQYD